MLSDVGRVATAPEALLLALSTGVYLTIWARDGRFWCATSQRVRLDAPAAT
ncbi:hypothetical protein [Pyrobaculum aerophilum]|uniref:hypothetical protein n=1 Tax=Pyrobaculum aerophilum TaxID=13773 RepID=UPI0015F26B5C|nr:hypothetical protein [Pyrobaculum aerophilum]